MLRFSPTVTVSFWKLRKLWVDPSWCLPRISVCSRLPGHRLLSPRYVRRNLGSFLSLKGMKMVNVLPERSLVAVSQIPRTWFRLKVCASLCTTGYPNRTVLYPNFAQLIGIPNFPKYDSLLSYFVKFGTSVPVHANISLRACFYLWCKQTWWHIIYSIFFSPPWPDQTSTNLHA